MSYKLINLSCALFKVWFSNRRARWRKQNGANTGSGYDALMRAGALNSVTAVNQPPVNHLYALQNQSETLPFTDNKVLFETSQSHNIISKAEASI